MTPEEHEDRRSLLRRLVRLERQVGAADPPPDLDVRMDDVERRLTDVEHRMANSYRDYQSAEDSRADS